MSRPFALTFALSLALAVATTSASAQQDAAAPSLTVTTGPAEYGDYFMHVQVDSVTLGTPGTADTHHLVYTVNGETPGDDPYGTAAITTERSFFFTGLDHGDVVAVELVKSDGSSYDPALRIEQTAASPYLAITSAAPTVAGNYSMTVDVRAFDLVSPGLEGSKPGEGHLHYYVNGEPAPPSRNGTTYDTAFESYHFVNLSGGDVVGVELVTHDHDPLSPRVVASQRIGAGPSAIITSPTPSPGEHTLEVEVVDHDGELRYALNGETVAVTTDLDHTFDDLEAGDVLTVELVDATGDSLTPPFVLAQVVQAPGGLDDSGGSVSAPLPDPVPDPGPSPDTNEEAPPAEVHATNARGWVLAIGVVGAVAAGLVATFVAMRRR